MSQLEGDNRIPDGTPEDAARLNEELDAINREIESLKAGMKRNAGAKAAPYLPPVGPRAAMAAGTEVLRKALSVAKWRVMLGMILVSVSVSSFMVAQEAAAWFVINRTVDSNNMNVDVDPMSARANYYVYIHDAKAGRVLYTGDPYTAYSDPTIKSVDMQFHDMIFKIRNRYTPAIIRIELDDMNAAWGNGGTVFITITRDLTKPATVTEGAKTRLSDYFTSVMRFTLAQDKDWYPDAVAAAREDASLDEGDELYTIIDAALYDTYSQKTDNTDESKVFTTVSGSSFTKEDSIVLQVSYVPADIVDNTLNLYLYVTYDETLLTHYQASAGISGDQTIGKTVAMADDIDELTITFEVGD